jgi:hypothetical protein
VQATTTHAATLGADFDANRYAASHAKRPDRYSGRGVLMQVKTTDRLLGLLAALAQVAQAIGHARGGQQRGTTIEGHGSGLRGGAARGGSLGVGRVAGQPAKGKQESGKEERLLHERKWLSENKKAKQTTRRGTAAPGSLYY